MRTRTWTPPTTEEERAEMVRRYVQDKQPIRTIATAMNRAYHTVWNVLVGAKVEMRRRGGLDRGGRPSVDISTEERAVILRMQSEGTPQRQIAKTLHRGQQTIVRILREEGAPPYPSVEPKP